MASRSRSESRISGPNQTRCALEDSGQDRKPVAEMVGTEELTHRGTVGAVNEIKLDEHPVAGVVVADAELDAGKLGHAEMGRP